MDLLLPGAEEQDEFLLSVVSSILLLLKILSAFVCVSVILVPVCFYLDQSNVVRELSLRIKRRLRHLFPIPVANEDHEE